MVVHGMRGVVWNWFLRALARHQPLALNEGMPSGWWLRTACDLCRGPSQSGPLASCTLEPKTATYYCCGTASKFLIEQKAPARAEIILYLNSSS